MNNLEKIDYINMLAQMTLKARIADNVYEPNGSHYDYDLDDIVEDVVYDLTSDLDYKSFNYEALCDGAEAEVRKALDIEKLDEIARIDDYAPTQSEIDEHRANLGAFREVLV